MLRAMVTQTDPMTMRKRLNMDNMAAARFRSGEERLLSVTRTHGTEIRR